MKLHEFPNEFKDLISIVAADKHLPESAIERDYYIVLLLQNLANSEYAEKCVFKGGTSLSKCYPGSIERFSEDIDLTFLGMDEIDKVCDKTIKKIEKVMTVGAETEKIDAERSNRSKSMFVWFGDKANRVKLEIGSSVVFLWCLFIFQHKLFLCVRHFAAKLMAFVLHVSSRAA